MSFHLDRRYLLLISGRLRNFKEKKSTLWNCSCPLCGDSKINQYKARGYFYEGKNCIDYKCHNCGISLSFYDFLKSFDPSKHKDYLIDKFSNSGNKRQYKKTLIKPEKIKEITVNKENLQTIRSLDENHFAKQYIKSRLIPEEYWDELFFVRDFKAYMMQEFPDLKDDLDKKLKEKDPRLVWFMTNIDMKVTHINGRALLEDNQRYIKIKVAGRDSDRKVFGLTRVDFSKPIYLTEGELDSLFLDNGVSGGDSSLENLANSIWEKFKVKGVDKVVLCWDNEPRNKEINKTMFRAIRHKHPVVIWENCPFNGKDINKMITNGARREDIVEYVKKNTYQGLEAELVFSNWKKCIL